MSDQPDDDGAPHARTAKALADAAALTGMPCRECATRLCGHEAVLCLVLGYKGAPRCLSCIAAHMAEPRAALRERALEYVRHHECFDSAWRRAGALEGCGEVARPPCLWGDGPAPPPRATAPRARDAAMPLAEGRHAAWDAGAMGCGDLVLELRLRLAALSPGDVLDLRATDPGAPVDLPAWCAMTGHVLVEVDHPHYRIRRRS